MPDHIHALLIFPRDRVMKEIIADWKGVQTKQHCIQWQGNYYEERISHGFELEKKAAHIRRNPVIKNLCTKDAVWPWVIDHPV